MARDAIAITELSINTAAAEPAGVAISVANGSYIDAGHTKRLLLVVRNTAGAEYDLTISSGGGITGLYGDLVVPVAATTGVQLVVVESARFIQDATGYILLDFETSMTGTVAAVRLPTA